MADQYVVAVRGLENLSQLDEITPAILEAASRAINDTTRKAYTESGRRIRRQIAFPARYLTGKDGRLEITQFAKPNDLESAIGGRRRATSLARFARGTVQLGGAKRKPGVHVEVKRGSAVFLPRAFIIKLRRGNADDAGFNLGLAVRTSNGQEPGGAYKPKKIGKGLWLLYGPSVDQAFIQASGSGGVADQIVPEVSAALEAEFLRQFRRSLQ